MPWTDRSGDRGRACAARRPGRGDGNVRFFFVSTEDPWRTRAASPSALSIASRRVDKARQGPVSFAAPRDAVWRSHLAQVAELVDALVSGTSG